LSKQPQHQGKFHLLAIFAIPVTLVLAFVVQNWWILSAYLLLLLIAIYLLFRKKDISSK
jgi:membrane protein YdbS with pleckstrin-like domain